MEFSFAPPIPEDSLSDRANAAILFAAISGRLAVEARTDVYNTDGRLESVAEHSHMLTVVAPELAARFFPELNADKIARYAAVHDILEAYVGDTPTHGITDEERIAKIERELAAFWQIKLDYAAYPSFVATVEQYEAQEIAETRFVRMVDKLMPLLVHINDNGAGLRSLGFTPAAIRHDAAKEASRLQQDYPDMALVIHIRNELAEYVASQLETN